MQVALFITCFNDTLFPNVGIATTHLLERLGHTVDFPEAQTCCGQMHFNTGYQRETIPLVRHFVEVFGTAEAIVAPSASCVGMVRDLSSYLPQPARVAPWRCTPATVACSQRHRTGGTAQCPRVLRLRRHLCH